jgi:hypothetical protein
MTQEDRDRLWEKMSFNGRMRWMRKFRSGVVAGGTANRESFEGLVASNPSDADMYIGLNIDACPWKQRVTAQDIVTWRYVCVDIDPLVPDANPLDFIVMTNLGGSVVVYSGRGIQLWYELPPTQIFDALLPDYQRRTNRFLTEYSALYPGTDWCVDTKVADLPRVVRCPGTINTKTGKMAEVWAWGTGPSKPLLDKLLGYDLAPLPEVVPLDKHLTNLFDLLPHLNVTSRRFLLHGADSPGRHSACYSTVKDLHDRGADRGAAETWTVAGAAKSLPPLPYRDTARIIKQVYGG